MSELTHDEVHTFRKHVSGLNRLIGRIRKRIPEANYYLDGASGLNLLSGDHHDYPEEIEGELILAEETLDHADGGDW